MRLLVVSPTLLYPANTGGRIRSSKMFERLSARHDITMLCLRKPEDTDRQVADMRACCARVETVDWRETPKDHLRFRLEVARSLFSRHPYSVLKYDSPALRNRLEGLLASEPFDVLVCDFLQPAINLLQTRFRPRVLFQHNVEAAIFRRHVEQARNPAERLVFAEEYRKLKRFEAEVGRAFDHCVMVSEADRKQMAAEYGVRTTSAVPTGVDSDYFAPMEVPAEPAALVFTGSMDWMANHDAVRFFVDDVLPRVRARRADATFWIVGRNPPAWLHALAERRAELRVTGTVDDIRPYLARAAVYVVPLRVGGGTRIKIFEAMAMGKAVVSTTVGAEGLPVQEGEHLLLRDEPQDFADAVLELLDAPARAEAIGARARQLVCERFGWDAAADAFQRACESVVSQRPPVVAS